MNDMRGMLNCRHKEILCREAGGGAGWGQKQQLGLNTPAEITCLLKCLTPLVC